MYQAITLLCALAFLCIKSYEYHDKFTHYEVQLNGQHCRWSVKARTASPKH